MGAKGAGADGRLVPQDQPWLRADDLGVLRGDGRASLDGRPEMAVRLVITGGTETADAMTPGHYYAGRLGSATPESSA
jgi:hypothetical protein